MITNRSISLTHSRIQAEGQKDGERNIPEMGSYTPAHFEQALIARGEQQVQRRYEKASLRIAKLQPRFQAYQKRFEDIESRVQGLIDRYKARKTELGRDLLAPVPYKYHLLVILFLAIGEFPLNTIVFRLFGEPEFMTYVMASTLAVTIPLLGLFIGIHLRQAVPRIAGNVLIGLLIPVSAGAALYGIGMLRNTYISSQLSVTTQVPTNQDQVVYALFALNILIFCAAMVISFFAHDPDERLDHCRASLVFLEPKRNALRKKLFRIGTKINGEIQKAKSQIEQVKALTTERIALYRQTNIRFRRLLAPPTFRKNPQFRELEWWPEVSLNSIGDHRDGG
ncbi:MAG: hypothetical protein O6826_01410 [Acidobacteria bacterium]|nr:hypothetical protein [Acidobacteriota bacterium]